MGKKSTNSADRIPHLGEPARELKEIADLIVRNIPLSYTQPAHIQPNNSSDQGLHRRLRFHFDLLTAPTQIPYIYKLLCWLQLQGGKTPV